jgi:hypothetical protein
VPADGPVGRDVLRHQRLGLGDDGVHSRGDQRVYPVDARGEVDGGRPGRPDTSDRRVEGVGSPSLAGALQERDRHPEGPCAAQRRGAAHHQARDGRHQSVHVADVQVGERRG